MKPEIQKIMDSDEFQMQGGVIGKDYELYMEPVNEVNEIKYNSNQLLMEPPLLIDTEIQSCKPQVEEVDDEKIITLESNEPMPKQQINAE